MPKKGFNIDYLLSFIVFALWFRMFAMLQLTKMFGPTINVIIEMTK